jgi:hypothetical protein
MNSQFYGKSVIPCIVSSVIRQGSSPPEFTICVLLYGENLELAKRCLNSIVQLPDPGRVELRIGMNEVGPATNEFVQALFASENQRGRTVLLYQSTSNRGKYPVMRDMFHDAITPICSPYVMWFDDDSYIKTPTRFWLDRVSAQMQTADMCGTLMSATLAGNQHLWIQLQPWYNGKPISQLGLGRAVPKSTSIARGLRYYVPQFAVGGWWTIRTKALKKLDWPPPNIIHRGGDFMLGEALRQHDARLVEFSEGVAINADLEGQNHKSPRRGLDPTPVGIDYQPTLTEALHLATKEIPPELLDYPGL